MVRPSDIELLYDYDKLLERLYKKLPTKKARASRFELPRVIAERVGGKTIIRNFKQLCGVMRREPRIVMRYLLRELGVAGNYDEDSGSLTISVRVSAQTLNTLLQRFVKMYVICPTCGAPDTKLERRDRAWMLVCEACGAEQPVPPF